MAVRTRSPRRALSTQAMHEPLRCDRPATWAQRRDVKASQLVRRPRRRGDRVTTKAFADMASVSMNLDGPDGSFGTWLTIQGFAALGILGVFWLVQSVRVQEVRLFCLFLVSGLYHSVPKLTPPSNVQEVPSGERDCPRCGGTGFVEVGHHYLPFFQQYSSSSSSLFSSLHMGRQMLTNKMDLAAVFLHAVVGRRRRLLSLQQYRLGEVPELWRRWIETTLGSGDTGPCGRVRLQTRTVPVNLTTAEGVCLIGYW